MIGQTVTGDDGKPLAQYDPKKLAKSSYQPSDEVKKLFNQCQLDYSIAWRLQHRPFDEFDGISLLQRAKRDQETFGAFVGAEYVPEHKRWRWKGRKNTARNKLIGILAHMIAAMLFPVVHASNEQNEEDKKAAQVMRILVENHLRKAGYEMKFLYMILSALVNPAVIVRVEYVEAIQKIKQQMEDGSVEIREAIDTFLSGLSLNIRPVDQFLVADFFTPDIQGQPYVIDVDRIPYDTASKIYGHHEDFKYVEAGKTRIVLAGQEHQTLYDIEWTEADRTAVQVLHFYYRPEDLEVTFVGGVFMGNKDDIYNKNPIKHRRHSLIGDEWVSIPAYKFAKSGFEPLDPTGRFFYYKSGAFKEYWDDGAINRMYQLLQDASTLDTMKPTFIDGVMNINDSVMRPGAVIGIPPGSRVEPYSMGPNLKGVMDVLLKNEQDMGESTQDRLMNGVADPNVTATASIQAQNQARIILGPFGYMVADLIRQVGELTVDCIIQHTTVGEIDATIPGTLNMSYRVILAKGKENGKNVTNRIEFKSDLIGKKMSQSEQDAYEWRLWKEAGGMDTDQVTYHVNPYKLARTQYDMYVDPDQIINTAMGNGRLRKLAAFQMFSNPLVQPMVDWKNVVDDFVIDEYAEGDPDRYRAKGNVNDLMGSIMGQTGTPGAPGALPTPSTVAGTAPLPASQ